MMREIDMKSWSRREHYQLFCTYAKPYFSLSAQLDLTQFKAWLKETGRPFFPWMVYLVSRVANEMPEFRQRIRAGAVVEHDVVHPSFTIMLPDERFGFCATPYQLAGDAFVETALERMTAAQNGALLSDDGDDLLFITSVPWVAFNGISHAMRGDDSDAVPRIAWGKYEQVGERWKMTLSVQVHHGLADGLHLGRFFARLQAFLTEPAKCVEGCSTV